jgi:hypothetical protein
VQNIENYIRTHFRVITLLYYNNSETKLQKIVQKFDNVEAYGKFVQAEFQETTIRRQSSSWRFQKAPLTGAKRNRLHRERRKRKGEDGVRPSSSADISDTDPPVDVDIELSVRELWEARWKTSSTRFKNMFSNNEFGLQCIVCDRDLMKAGNKHVDILRLHFSDPTTWLR